MNGPLTEVADRLHAQKYRGTGESFREAMNRVSSALEDSTEHYHTFRRILSDQRFLPAGRVQAAVGSPRQVTAMNCYVSGTIEDSFIEDGGIMNRATQAAQTMRMGGGIGYDFSSLRPRGDLITTLDSRSSGPVSFMDIYNAICLCIASSGHRRGAQMGVLRVDHPDIEEYIHAKQNTTQLTGFNLSIAVTDEFMEAVKSNNSFNLQWGGRVYKRVDARALWEQIMRSTWDWAEPGVLFIDTINKMNNLWYCEEIAATNPCSEQPLPPFGCCLLGSFNLVAYVYRTEANGNGQWRFDWEQFKKDIVPVIRAMDNVIDRTTYPLPEQQEEQQSKRRMGIGVTGLANAGEAVAGPYGSKEFITFTQMVMRTLTNNVYLASVALSREKGPFPLYDRDKYAQSSFIKSLNKLLQKHIYKYGIRNSHLTSIAPTGTISICADNISSGIEPVFAKRIERDIWWEGGKRTEVIEDYGKRMFGIEPKLASQCTMEDHLGVLMACYPYIDSGISKTCNVDPSMPWGDFKDLYFKVWAAGGKACSTFNINGKRMGLLQPADDVPQIEEVKGSNACYYDPVLGVRSCDA